MRAAKFGGLLLPVMNQILSSHKFYLTKLCRMLMLKQCSHFVRCHQLILEASTFWICVHVSYSMTILVSQPGLHNLKSFRCLTLVVVLHMNRMVIYDHVCGCFTIPCHCFVCNVTLVCLYL